MAMFSDQYTRKQGLRRTYHYKITTTAVGQAILWAAVVRYDGTIKGTPTGRMLYKMPVDVVEATARTLVEKAIEELADVAE